MQMRTTLNIDDELLAEAMRVTGLSEKTAVIHAGLEALIAGEAARRLAALAGAMPDVVASRRRQSSSGRSSR